MYYVYVLFSQNLNKKYIGVTGNLKQRIKSHKYKTVPFTSKTDDWKLIYYEVFISKKDAFAEEKFLKSGKDRERLKFLLVNTLK